MAKKWKYKEVKARPTANYLYFNEEGVKELKICDWSFDKHPAGYLFKCYVKGEDGEKVDKVWTVWDFDFAQVLKKKLGTKAFGETEIKVRMYKDEDCESTLEIVD